MKIVLLALAIIGLGARGYFMYMAQQAQTAKQTLASKGTVDQIRRNMQAAGPDAEADAAARGKDHAAPKRTGPVAVEGVAGGNPNATPAATVAASSNNNPADAGQRPEIEASLKAMHLTTIMPGQPGLVIIDKQEYAEGEDLPVGKGRKARIVKVQDDGVQLTCNGMAFHLDAPAAPDLAALRKKK